jgi:hypothetical protein
MSMRDKIGYTIVHEYDNNTPTNTQQHHIIRGSWSVYNDDTPLDIYIHVFRSILIILVRLGRSGDATTIIANNIKIKMLNYYV